MGDGLFEKARAARAAATERSRADGEARRARNEARTRELRARVPAAVDAMLQRIEATRSADQLARDICEVRGADGKIYEVLAWRVSESSEYMWTREDNGRDPFFVTSWKAFARPDGQDPHFQFGRKPLVQFELDRLSLPELEAFVAGIEKYATR